MPLGGHPHGGEVRGAAIEGGASLHPRLLGDGHVAALEERPAAVEVPLHRDDAAGSSRGHLDVHPQNHLLPDPDLRSIRSVDGEGHDRLDTTSIDRSGGYVDLTVDDLVAVRRWRRFVALDPGAHVAQRLVQHAE